MTDPEQRAVQTVGLERALANHYGLRVPGPLRDLGGLYNLNLLLDGPRKLVVRVYRPWVTAERLAEIQRVRAYLAAQGIPICPPVMASSGERWVTVVGRLVEVETFVAHDGWISDGDRLRSALPMLGRIHGLLGSFDVNEAGATAPFSCSIGRSEARHRTSAGLDRLRSLDPTPAEVDFAEQASRLAERLEVLEHDRPALPTQLVHGDYWHRNVFFRGRHIVHVGDFDFMGVRERIDDLALSLFFYGTNFKEVLGPPDITRIAGFGTLVDAYDAGLTEPLSEEERHALPLALARAPLAFVAQMRGIPEPDVHRMARRLGADIAWAHGILDHLEAWQSGFTHRIS